MRSLDQRLCDILIREFSHDPLGEFDPARGIGTQRERAGSLGFGALYMSLVQVLDASHVLVVGSGRGFSAACFALGLEAESGRDVTLVDPGYSSWKVDDRVTDRANGLWRSVPQAEAHFHERLGLDNVCFMKSTSDEAFQQFSNAERRFDIVCIDADHGYAQVRRDLAHALDVLAPDGMICLHDSHSREWPGVAAALADFGLEHDDLQVFTFPLAPGLSFIMRRIPLLTLRYATPEENERINAWRVEDGVTPRPLPDAHDPRLGPGEDPRQGLFAVVEGDRVIGGVGVQYRHFGSEGPDDFVPLPGMATEGYLRYGSVLRRETRGRGRWRLVDLAFLRWFGDTGFFFLTKHPMKLRRLPYVVEKAGQTPNHTAYRKRPAGRPPPRSVSTYSMDRYHRVVQRCDDLSRRNEELEAEAGAIRNSLSWRLTGPIRKALDVLRGVT